MKTVAISVGDLNGIGIQIALEMHKTISQVCKPIYCIDDEMLQEACKLLHTSKPHNFITIKTYESFKLQPKSIEKASGAYSFASFKKAINLVEDGTADALVTLPIHKKAWQLAGVPYKGHTHYLKEHFKRDAIMMLGCEDLYVGLFTEHIALKELFSYLDKKSLTKFLVDFYNSTHFEHIGVLGVNPHAGDDGVLGNEEVFIKQAIQQANTLLNQEVFIGPLVPDVAFTPYALSGINRLVALYHDQGLAPLKALYFDQSINVSLNLPILRTSVDHGTAFDIAYSNTKVQTKSYYNAVRYAISRS